MAEAEVNLKTVWLNRATDPSDARSFPELAALSVTTAVDGEVRKLAGGRRRAIRRKGKAGEPTLAIPYCPRSSIEWLEEHTGEVVCVRDDRGRKIFAVYFQVQVDENRSTTDYGSVTVTLNEVTHSEVV